MSSLAWIDFDETERDRAQRIMDMFRERNTRDELGLGAIRDSIADHLFPGTSTIQTRLRYMLFIPWLFQKLEGLDLTPEQLAARSRELQNQLANALKANNEPSGVIGRDAGADLQRLPSSVYWAGLGHWGIRRFPGSIDNFYASLRHLQRSRTRLREGEEADARSLQFWATGLPPSPDGLLEQVGFRLRQEEAQFILDRLVDSHPDSLLTFLARGNDPANCDAIWEHPHLADFPSAIRALVEHAGVFSSVMHGASLLYKLLLSELREKDDWVAEYEEMLGAWRAGLDMSAILTWSLPAFWQIVAHPAHSIRPAARHFVTQWLEIVRSGDIRTGAAARLVREREHRLKTNQSRFANRAVRDRWNGASGIDRLSFRWADAKSHLQDLANVE